MKHSEDIGPTTTPIFLPTTAPSTLQADKPHVSQQRGPRFPVKIIDLYLFNHVVQATLRGLGWFAGLLVAVAVITAARKLVDNSLTLGSMAVFIAYQIPRILLFTLPMSILYGTVQAFTDLSSRGEVTATFGGGMSLRRMLVAPLTWGAMLMLVAFILQERLMPFCERQKEVAVVRSVANSKVQEHFRFEDPPSNRGPLKRLIQAESFDPKTGTLIQPRIQEHDEDQHVSKEVYAERAVWNLKTGQWDFYAGEVIYHNRTRTEVQAKSDDKNDFIWAATFKHLSYKAPDPHQLGSATMNMRQHLEHGDFEMASIAELMGYRELVRHEMQDSKDIAGVKSKNELIQGITFGIHDKIATPFICIALVLIGVPLGIRPQRSVGSGVAMGLSLIVLLFYYVGYILTQTWGGSGDANPMLMAYLSPVATALVGCGLVWKKDRC
ncbi:MAG: LptF/LptG family permease [Abitibacteriaceae bacterium]|nr:LptF/LptG family permease [Abditibacteriaceae bacterium]